MFFEFIDQTLNTFIIHDLVSRMFHPGNGRFSNNRALVLINYILVSEQSATALTMMRASLKKKNKLFHR